ncbi:mitochondrial fission factor-like isoform X4 [Pygocentrus nattereri]|uniref:mitochondrial fission factor-like isoform X4 n=1 Tax=Pygocentrus nattereri TaxID=42514 RepID=UPI001891BD56|nr:mitochondrial fission factor-like isoform X4 [Pygocentrus nattereri]
MAAPVYLGEGSQVRGGDPYFTEIISKRMRVPDRLSVGHGILAEEQRPEDLLPVYSMHVPDRLALTDAPDLSPRPLFSKQSASSMWDLQRGTWGKEAYTREPVQSPLRRSYSDQTFGRTPPGTPTHSKQALHSPSMFGFQENPPPQPEIHTDQTRKSTVQESWLSPEEETGTAVEFIVLRRQVVKMSRRIAGLERQNAERRQNELVLFSLLLSACLLNGWLWMRR